MERGLFGEAKLWFLMFIYYWLVLGVWWGGGGRGGSLTGITQWLVMAVHYSVWVGGGRNIKEKDLIC